MFTRLFPSADFGDKERRLIFEEAQNAPEQSFAEKVESQLPDLESKLDSPLKAQAMVEIRAALAEKDVNAMKKGIENALSNIARTEFVLLKDKYKGDEKQAFDELQADFRTLGNGMVNVYGKNPDGTFAIQMYVPGAQNRLPTQGGPDAAPNAPAAAPNAPAAAPKEVPADIPAEKIKDLPQDAQDWIQEVYKNLPPYQKGVVLDYISAQEGRAVVVGLGEKTGKFNPEIMRALAALNGDALKDPSKIKDQGLQDLVKSLTPAERTLLSKLMNFKETPEKGKLTEVQKKQIESDGQAIMREYQKILAENPNPTKQQQEQFLAKLQMKGCDVTNEKALLAGDASAIKALDGAGWERTMNQVMGLFRYLSTAITTVKEKISGKKSEAGTEGKADKLTETPEYKSLIKGKAILKDAGETVVGTLYSFNKDKGILPKVGDQENFPVFQFENGAWQMKLNVGGPGWTNVESAKLPDMPTTLTEEQKQTYKRWEKARVELGKLNEETAKALAEAKPASDVEKPKVGEGDDKKTEPNEKAKEKPVEEANVPEEMQKAAREFNEDFRNQYAKIELKSETVDGKSRVNAVISQKENYVFESGEIQKLEKLGAKITDNKIAVIEGVTEDSLSEVIKVPLLLTGREQLDAAAQGRGEWVPDPTNPQFELIQVNGKVITQNISGVTASLAEWNEGKSDFAFKLQDGKYFDKKTGEFQFIPPPPARFNKESRAWEVPTKEDIKAAGEKALLNDLGQFGLSASKQTDGHYLVDLSLTSSNLKIQFNEKQSRWEWAREGEDQWYAPSEYATIRGKPFDQELALYDMPLTSRTTDTEIVQVMQTLERVNKTGV